jgi:hypothetical protein
MPVTTTTLPAEPADVLTPEPGRYGVVRTNGWVPAIIRFLTRSRFDHAFIVIDPEPGTGRARIVEAEPGGARIAYLDEYDPATVLITDEPLTDTQRAAIVRDAVRLVGTPYGFVDILRLALMLTIHRAPLWLAKRADLERAMICSQLVAAVGQDVGLDWLCGPSSPASVTPGMLGARIIARAWATS